MAVFKGNIPSASALMYWVCSKSSIAAYNGTVVYKIEPGGFMSQFCYIKNAINSLNVNIKYIKSSLKEATVKVYCCSQDNKSDVTSVQYLDSTSKFMGLSYDIDVSTDCAYANIDIRNNSDKNLYIAAIEVDIHLNKAKETKNVNDFPKYAITYGLDADKPKLR